jgi:hypothetical protein
MSTMATMRATKEGKEVLVEGGWDWQVEVDIRARCMKASDRGNRVHEPVSIAVPVTQNAR